MKLKHVDCIAGCVYQDAREVHTKFSKTFDTFFFPVGEEIIGIVTEWVTYLRNGKLWGNDDPLFPSTLIEVGPSRQFEAAGLARKCWSTAPLQFDRYLKMPFLVPVSPISIRTVSQPLSS